MKPCEVCGKSHHLHSENDLSKCLVWGNYENRKLKAEVKRLRMCLQDCIDLARTLSNLDGDDVFELDRIKRVARLAETEEG